jgi:hypothetical protein
MKKVDRSEILSNAEYERKRDEMRSEILHVKRDRRIHLGQNLTLLFENHATVHYHIQEALRIEKQVDETMIQRELQHFNELIGRKGELGCSLLVEIDETTQHGLLMSEWQDVPQKIYIKTKRGQKVPAELDPKNLREKSVHGVHHIIFRIGEDAPLAVGCDHPGVHMEVALLPSQLAALTEDLHS